MNSFKLFNRTNKNDIVSNYLNEVEYKEKDNLINDNEPNINKITTTNFEENRIENTSDQENDDNKEKIVVGHHYFEKDSSIISKESSNELSEKEQKKTKNKEKRKKKKHKNKMFRYLFYLIDDDNIHFNKRIIISNVKKYMCVLMFNDLELNSIPS